MMIPKHILQGLRKPNKTRCKKFIQKLVKLDYVVLIAIWKSNLEYFKNVSEDLYTSDLDLYEVYFLCHLKFIYILNNGGKIMECETKANKSDKLIILILRSKL